MTLAEKVKSLGFKSVNEVSEISSASRETLRNWNINKPDLLEQVLFGCIMSKLIKLREQLRDEA
jgi:hypothetical protein